MSCKDLLKPFKPPRMLMLFCAPAYNFVKIAFKTALKGCKKAFPKIKKATGEFALKSNMIADAFCKGPKADEEKLNAVLNTIASADSKNALKEIKKLVLKKPKGLSLMERA